MMGQNYSANTNTATSSAYHHTIESEGQDNWDAYHTSEFRMEE